MLFSHVRVHAMRLRRV